ncbi:hypothetical protein Lal_00018472 [Lupinus albus]|nr:hypothetical protein Lal_00018472 [Lupinus albus]
MSSRRSRSRQSDASADITDAQITDLVSKLQQLIPELRATHRRADKVLISFSLRDKDVSETVSQTTYQN